MMKSGLTASVRYHNVDDRRGATWIRHGLAVFSQALDMELNSDPHLVDDLFPRRSCRDATGKVRRVSGEVPACLLNNDGVFHNAPSVRQPSVSFDATSRSGGEVVG